MRMQKVKEREKALQEMRKKAKIKSDNISKKMK